MNLMKRYGELLNEVKNYFSLKKGLMDSWIHVKCRLVPTIQTFDT